MKFSYDPQADALSLRLTDARIDDTDELQPGIIVDYDANGQVVAVEVLNVQKRTQPVEVNLEASLPVFDADPREGRAEDYVAGTITSGSFIGDGASNVRDDSAKAANTLIKA